VKYTNHVSGGKALFLACILCLIAYSGVSSASDMGANDPTSLIEDMRVKVMGGYVRITRTWNGRSWEWNSRWNPPKKDSGLLLKRGSSRYTYTRMEDGKMVFEDASRNQFSVNPWPTEFEDREQKSGLLQWRDRVGNKITYSSQDLIRFDSTVFSSMESYSDKNGVLVSFNNNEDGLISSIKDHFGNVVITYHWETVESDAYYSSAGPTFRIVKISDYSGREVDYTYSNSWLTSVNDVDGEEWRYVYNTDTYTDMTGAELEVRSTLRTGERITVIDPLNRETSYAIGWGGDVRQIHHYNGSTTIYESEYDDDRGLTYSTSEYSDGTIVEEWRDSDGRLVERRNNGELESAIEYHASNGKSLSSISRYYKRHDYTEAQRSGSSQSGIVPFNPADAEYCSMIGGLLKTNSNFLRGSTGSGCGFSHIYGLTNYSHHSVRMAERKDGTDPLTRREPPDMDPAPYIRKKIVTDGEGRETVYEYDQWGNETTVTYPDGSTVETEWHKDYAFPLSVTDENGVTTRYEYDDNGNLITLIEAYDTEDERTTRYVYDQYGQVIELITGESARGDTDLAVTQYDYDLYGNLIEIVDPLGNITRFLDHDVLGNPGKVVDAKANFLQEDYAWHLEYDASGNIIAEVNPLGERREYSYDGAGHIESYTRATGNNFSVGSNEFGFPLTVSDAVGNTKNIDYDQRYRMANITDASSHSISIAYNEQGFPSAFVDGEGNRTVFSYQYNKLTETKFPTYSVESTYDSRGRLKEYVAHGNGTDITDKHGYDLAGNLTNVADSNGKEEFYYYDHLGRLSRVVDPQGGETYFRFDARDNLLSVTDPEGRMTQYRYDLRDQVIAEVKPSGERQYQYDANGNLAKEVTPKGEVKRYSYDRANRLDVEKVYVDIDRDAPVKVVKYRFNEEGQSLGYTQTLGDDSEGVTDDIQVLEKISIYNDLDQLESVSFNFGSFSKAYSYSYYPNGLRKTYTNAENITYTYYYNANNDLTAVHIPGRGQLSFAQFEWLYPQVLLLPGGSQITISYDDFMRIEEQVLKDPANNDIAGTLYKYDRVGNITNLATDDGTYSFSYDSLYQLAGASYPELLAVNDEQFSYDGAGNRLAKITSQSAIESVYNDQNQLIKSGEAIFTYNANGHTETTTEDGHVTEYIYNHEERLIAVKVDGNNVGQYAYNPEGHRIKKTENGVTTYFLYNEEGLAAEYDVSGNLIKEYHFKPYGTWMTEPLFQRTADGQVYYYQNDHMGTPHRLVRSNGEVVWQAFYSAFGDAEIVTQVVENNLRFPGQYFDQETELHHNYFRDYDYQVGRYVQSDPIGLDGGLNYYAYAYANPVVFYDPTGEFGVAGAIAGAACSAASGGSPCEIMASAASGLFGFLGGAVVDQIGAQICKEPDDCRGVGQTSASQAMSTASSAMASEAAGGMDNWQSGRDRESARRWERNRAVSVGARVSMASAARSRAARNSARGMGKGGVAGCLAGFAVPF